MVIIVVALLLFGGKRLPGLAKGFGEGIRNFKRQMKSGGETKEPEKSRK